ncbi:hypothetical protein DH2020_010585 [Rehmannia glutinosa]|uniref:Uncharacterized protein n=1 Tax=Rehmannia glutinosa TaxID=99300 RepID=A0ABR0XB39_REHGL
MHDFSTADGFAEITENLADMIKFVANEPSVGLFYIQQHTHNATPNLLNLKNNVVEKSHETTLHTEDLEDSIVMLRSMKECGFPIADEMIKDIKKSLSIVSTKQPKRGLIYNSSTAKQTANNFKRPQVESKEAMQSKPFDLNPAVPSTSSNTLTVPEAENEELDFPLSSEIERELQEESQLSKSLSHQQFLSLYENYDEFKADREAKLEEWLGGTGDEEEDRGLRKIDGEL